MCCAAVDDTYGCNSRDTICVAYAIDAFRFRGVCLVPSNSLNPTKWIKSNVLIEIFYGTAARCRQHTQGEKERSANKRSWNKVFSRSIYDMSRMTKSTWTLLEWKPSKWKTEPWIVASQPGTTIHARTQANSWAICLHCVSILSLNIWIEASFECIAEQKDTQTMGMHSMRAVCDLITKSVAKCKIM